MELRQARIHLPTLRGEATFSGEPVSAMARVLQILGDRVKLEQAARLILDAQERCPHELLGAPVKDISGMYVRVCRQCGAHRPTQRT